MRIALDAMGSDSAPVSEVHGAVVAAKSSDVEILLVGDERELKPALGAYRNPRHVTVVHASERIGMDEPPVTAIRQKKDSSLLVGLRLVKSGEADAFVSAGNTGAVMVGARTTLGPIRGVARSAICQILPTLHDPVLVLDLGANVDCTARHLCDFAEMGMIYAKRVLEVEEPRVGLLNIGEEDVKGNSVAKAVHQTLSAATHIHFVGNIEPSAMFQGAADVVVCDGFVGNVVLKTSEAVARLIGSLLKRDLKSSLISRIGALISLGALRRLKRDMDPNEYTGAPLLGVNGVVIILHGSCKARAVVNAIQGACRAVEAGLTEHIRKGVQELRQAEAGLDDAGAPEVAVPGSSTTAATSGVS
ncbi:MAG TPA: phosphate acyltransferase PlsX [Candidatus Hydrogenedentes bacterium]|nr:phosphate acyltransferase PlsX [Candidatus Hydrogenedentota bacterium]HPG66231.1 phosphate acyltransferase PlsX [Candidatus Hydrogenedentota bacterium]